MPTVLARLYRTKLALLATLCTGSGTALLFLTHSAEWAWLDTVPVTDIGSALLTTGLVAIAFEYFDARDADQRLQHSVRSVMREQAPAVRNAVLDGFATAPETLTQIASPETLDRVIGNALAARIHDGQLARDVYTDLRDQILHATEYRYEARTTITLTPWDQGPRAGLGSMFVATVRFDYRTRNLPDVLRFTTVEDHTEYRRLLHDPATTEVWLFEPTAGLAVTDPQVFHLVHCAIDGDPQPITHQQGEASQTFTVPTGQIPDGRTRHVAYTHRGLITQHGHQLFLDLPKPTKGLDVEFHYGGCGIRHVNILDFIASHQQPRITKNPAPSPFISIGFDGWTFPKSGLAFTWVLHREVEPPPTT